MTTRLSQSEAASLGLAKRGNKFGARKTVVDGITFDSKREAAYYSELKQREAAGEAANVELQPRFPLKVENEIIGVYRADFAFWDSIQKRRRVVDVKGVLTRDTKRSIKHVKAQYGIEVEIVK